MVEVAMAMPALNFGPAVMGPTMGSGDVHTFNPSLGKGAFDRLAKDNINAALKAQASDLATNRNEFIDKEIGIYKLKVQKAQYEDKLSGQLKEELTLVSPDFHNEAIGVWTDAGEHGTGTPGEYGRIVDRANQLAAIEEDATMFWINPGDENSQSEAPHRAYLWVKQADEVTAYAYSLTGNRDSLAKMMQNLGFNEGRDKIALEDQTIIKREKNYLTHKDIYKAFTASLKPEEKLAHRDFLDRFKKDIEVPDRVREDKVKRYKESYESQLREKYQGDIQEALESFAQGFAAISRLKLDKSDNQSQTNLQNLRHLKGGPVRNSFQAEKSAQRKDKNYATDLTRERVARDIQPIVSGMIALVNYGSTLKVTEQPQPLEKPTNMNLYALRHLKGGRMVYPVRNSSQVKEFTQKVSPEQALLVWQQTLIRINNMQEEYLSIPIPSGVFNALPDPEQLHGTPLTYEQESIILREVINNKDDKIKVTRWQKTLEDITHYMFYTSGEKLLYDESNIEDSEKMMVEGGVVSLAKDILRELTIKELDIFEIKSEEDQSLGKDGLLRLAFFIKLYEDEETSEALKHLLSALIYIQIREIRKDKVFIDQSPQISLLFRHFDDLSQKAEFLEDRFFAVIDTLEKMTRIKLLTTTDGQADINTLLKKVFILLYLLSMRQNGVRQSLKDQIIFNPELLTNSQLLKSQFILPNKKKMKQSSRRFSPYGIIYQYQYLLAQRVLYMSE